MADDRKRVVIAGGGVAGSKIAKDLETIADVTLIDPKNYYEIPYPEPRSNVEPSFADRTLILYGEFLKSARHVQSIVTDATKDAVITASGENIPYDYLVIATGSVYDGPPTKEERLKQFEANNKRIVKAETVLIVGGGPVGVELAAEIATDFPNKKVTLVTNSDRLLTFVGPKASVKTSKWLKKKNVEVILQDRIDISDSLSAPDYETRNHKKIKADTHFLTVGKKLSSDWIKGSDYLKGALSELGRLKVEPTTQVVGFPKVFAVGDITSFEEIKQGYLASKHADVFVGNFKKLIKNPNETKLQTYKVLKDPFGLVSLGRKEGVLALPFATFLGWIPGKLKSKDFFVGKVRGELGLPAK